VAPTLLTKVTTVTISLSLLILIVIIFFAYVPMAEARCPNGYHKSPSGDCEKVVPHVGKLPRCPNGYHRSPDGDCERVSDGSSSSSPTVGTAAPSSARISTAAEATLGKCDESLWDHVYNPSRLQVVDSCITITGTIDSIRAEKDGDLHIRLSVDSQYSHLINQANKDNQFGDLVLEPICVREVTQASAIAACQNFRQAIDIPPVGTHVRVTGSYVLDHEHSDWAEIHPITSIEATPS
jgi:hypothetical protein